MIADCLAVAWFQIVAGPDATTGRFIVARNDAMMQRRRSLSASDLAWHEIISSLHSLHAMTRFMWETEGTA
jgi:hypothetical protein